MSVTYFKRYRMEVDLKCRLIAAPSLPPAYSFVPWHRSLLDVHAETKFRSFRNEIDANVFPCLGDSAGCLSLMREIYRKEGFLPDATWLLSWRDPRTGRAEFCGTIQGVRDRPGVGSIQNVGITPEHRDRGLGTKLLLKSLIGFRLLELRWVFLEVTCQNEGAIRLYRRLGFAKARTVYKAVEMACS